MGRLTDSSDTALWDSFNADLIELSGTDGVLYSLDVSQQSDALYDEPKAFVYESFDIMFYVRQPDREIDVSERGSERIQTTQVWFSRAHLEDRGAPIPKEGDVLQFWGGQYDLEDVKDDTHVPTDVSRAFQRDGGGEHQYEPDGAVPIQFVMNAKRRERFLPERKTAGVLPVSEDTL